MGFKVGGWEGWLWVLLEFDWVGWGVVLKALKRSICRSAGWVLLPTAFSIPFREFSLKSCDFFLPTACGVRRRRCHVDGSLLVEAQGLLVS